MMRAALALSPVVRTVPLAGFAMELRPSELAAVATGYPAERTPAALCAALLRLDVADRAPTWELSMRHFGRGKPADQAAGEIGMDALHAAALLAQLDRALSDAA